MKKTGHYQLFTIHHSLFTPYLIINCYETNYNYNFICFSNKTERMIIMLKSIISISLLFFLYLINASYGAEAFKGNLFNDKGSVNIQRNSLVINVREGNSEITGAGDIVRTGDESLAHLEFSDGSLIHIQANTTFQLKTLVTEDNKNCSIFKIVIGTISVFVNKITGKEQDYEIETPTSVASVRGTQFQMNVYVDEDYNGKEENTEKTITVLSVQEGDVELSSEDRKRILNTIGANTSVFVTPDRELHYLDKFINLIEMRQDEIKRRVRNKIKNYFIQKLPGPDIPGLPF